MEFFFFTPCFICVIWFLLEHNNPLFLSSWPELNFYTPCCNVVVNDFSYQSLWHDSPFPPFHKRIINEFCGTSYSIPHREQLSLVFVLLGCDFTLNQHLSVLRYFCPAFHEYSDHFDPWTLVVPYSLDAFRIQIWLGFCHGFCQPCSSVWPTSWLNSQIYSLPRVFHGSPSMGITQIEASIKNLVIFYVVFGVLVTIVLNTRWSIIWYDFQHWVSCFHESLLFCDRSDIERSLKFRIVRAAQFCFKFAFIVELHQCASYDRIMTIRRFIIHKLHKIYFTCNAIFFMKGLVNRRFWFKQRFSSFDIIQW